MIAIALGYRSQKGTAVPVVLYCGHDAPLAKEQVMNPPRGFERTELFLNPQRTKQRVHLENGVVEGDEPESPKEGLPLMVELTLEMEKLVNDAIEEAKVEFQKQLDAAEDDFEKREAEFTEKLRLFEDEKAAFEQAKLLPITTDSTLVTEETPGTTEPPAEELKHTSDKAELGLGNVLKKTGGQSPPKK